MTKKTIKPRFFWALPKDRIIKTRELQLGDKIRPIYRDIPSAYSDCTVKRIAYGLVHLFRPFVHTNDAVCFDEEVGCYIGIEEYTIYHDSDNEWLLLDRTEVK